MTGHPTITADWVWHDGKLVPFAEAQTHVSAFTLHYGLGVFEGLRCYRRADGRSAIFRLHEHIERFFASARTAAMELPLTAHALADACLETVRANRLDEAYVRPLAYVGAGVLGMGARTNPVQIAVLAFPWTGVLGADAQQRGIRAHVSSFVRGHLNATMSKAKLVGQYTSSVIAKRESQRLGYDEALMLDADGRVAEGTAENVFVVWQGRLWTPPLDLPILAGITRDSVITLARAAGVEVVEASFPRDLLYGASEIFLTGTATEVTPVREIDGRPVGSGAPGPITRQVQAGFLAATRGPGEPHPTWLSYL